MSETIVVFWLLLHTGAGNQPPVFLPEPFKTLEDCRTAGEVFKDSPVDRYEFGAWACLPQMKETNNAS